MNSVKLLPAHGQLDIMPRITSATKNIMMIAASACVVLSLTACNKQSVADKEQVTPNEPKPQLQPQKIRIAAAANLSDVLPDIIAGYKLQKNLPDQEIEVTFASSGKLYAQIIAGAPYDIFLSANQEFPTKWVQQRHPDSTKHEAFTYTQGQLSFYSANKPVGKLSETTLTQLLAEQNDSKITIANPELAPYGASAKAYLQAHNLYEPLNRQKRLIEAENIGQAFQYANTGNVDYGFVAQSQVTAIKATPEQFYTLPTSAYPAILQDGIVISDATVATDFTSYLLSPAGQKYFVEAGYLAVQ